MGLTTETARTPPKSTEENMTEAERYDVGFLEKYEVNE